MSFIIKTEYDKIAVRTPIAFRDPGPFIETTVFSCRHGPPQRRPPSRLYIGGTVYFERNKAMTKKHLDTLLDKLKKAFSEDKPDYRTSGEEMNGTHRFIRHQL